MNGKITPKPPVQLLGTTSIYNSKQTSKFEVSGFETNLFAPLFNVSCRETLGFETPA